MLEAKIRRLLRCLMFSSNPPPLPKEKKLLWLGEEAMLTRDRYLDVELAAMGIAMKFNVSP